MKPRTLMAATRCTRSRKNKLLGIALGLSSLATCVGQIHAEEFPRVLETPKPSSQDRLITRTVSRLLQNGHLSKAKIDDEISRRAFDQFMRLLDPMKMYFLQSDIDEFAQKREQLDDMLLGGDVSFAYDVFRRYNQRLTAAMPMIHAWIDADHDFTVDETVAIDRDVVSYPKSEEEQKDRWRKTIKLNLLDLKSDGKQIDEIRKQLHSRFRVQERNGSQMDVYELLEFYLSSFTTSLDPHTTYMAPRAQSNFDIQLKLSLDGIGASLRSEDGYVTVMSIVPGGAAEKDGRLKKGDRIVAVGQEGSPEDIDVVEKKTDDVVDLIRGPAGTKVRLTVEPKLGGGRQVFEIVRAKIQLEDEAARGEVLERFQKADGSPYKIGYLNLPSFYLDMDGARENKPNYRSTTRDVRNILKDFKEKGVDSVVLDLSKNGGGSLTEAINCTGLFIDRGPVVQVKDPSGAVQPYEDEERGVAWDGPLVVVTSKMSASASEIFAGAIKDYQRGLVVGDPQTHGKGTVQTLLDIGEMLFRAPAGKPYGALKLTIQQFYLPNGQSTQREGVSADVVLPSITAYMDIGESDLDYALPPDEVAAQEHQHYQMVNDAIRTQLQQKSIARVEQSEDFDKLLKRIEFYKKQKEEKYVSLKEEDFLKRRAELNSEEEEEKQILDAQTPAEKPFVSGYYNDEVLQVTRDYYDALQAINLVKAG
jgi:carboxyl-terminal processing protease